MNNKGLRVVVTGRPFNFVLIMLLQGSESYVTP